jgi:hypothetical protein
LSQPLTASAAFNFNLLLQVPLTTLLPPTLHIRATPWKVHMNPKVSTEQIPHHHQGSTLQICDMIWHHSYTASLSLRLAYLVPALLRRSKLTGNMLEGEEKYLIL